MKLSKLIFQKKTKITQIESLGKTHDGKTIVQITLKTMRKRVYGSQAFTILGDEPKVGKKSKKEKLVKIVAYDVKKIKIDPNLLDLIDYDEKKKVIVYPGHFRYDVSRRNGDVWLTAVSFNEKAKQLSRERFTQTFNALFKGKQ